MPDSLSLARYREVLRSYPALGEKIVEVYQHGNGLLSIRYANGRLSEGDSRIPHSLTFHPDVLSCVETQFVVSTMNIPLTPYNTPFDYDVRMIYVISGVFVDLGGGYHFRTPLAPNASRSLSPSHHHHKCSRCKKVRTCSGAYCYHQLKIHCDDCNEYFLLKRGRDADNISLDTEAGIPLNIHNSGANCTWAEALTETRPVEPSSGGVTDRTYTVQFNDNPAAYTGTWDTIISDWALHADEIITGRTGGNEDSNL